MSEVVSEYNDRLEKLSKLKELGLSPYPSQSSRTHTIDAFLNNFEALEKSAEKIILSGRLMSKREHGNISFASLDDGSSRTQLVLSKKEMEDEGTYKTFLKLIDVADFIEVSGHAFTTKVGEKSLKVSSWTILSKALRPLPEKFHGLKDEEERYRKRYLDILTNQEVRDLLIKKSKFWDTARSFMKERGFIEVETPTLEVTTGGAEARPFMTHHNDYDIPVYLRISVGELWQKRLMAASMDKTFEIGRIYRNEGSSPEHLQEFTNMEFYWSYANYKDGMDLVRDLYRKIAQDVFGTLKFEARGHKFDLADEWKQIDYVDEIVAQTGLNILEADESQMKAKLDELGVKYEGDNKERLIDSLWKYCRKNIAGPAFLVNHPKIVSPLAKDNAQKPGTVERFQPIIAGAEVGNGFSELNDPVDQKERFEFQQKLLEAGDEEAMMPDFEFVEMLEHGMPPACGFGFGERLFAFLAGKSVRETQTFPLMKPKKEELSKKKMEEKYREKKIVVIADESVGYGVASNAVGQLGIEIGLFSNSKLYDTKHLHDKDGRVHYVDAFYGMSNLSGTKEDMRKFVMKCHDVGIQVFDFSDIMRKAHTDKQMIEGYKSMGTEEIDYIAVGAVIPAEFEKEFLSSLKLFGSK